jgi:TolB-like protein
MRRQIASALLGVLLIASQAQALPSSPIAVMPFRNLSADADLDWLSLGIAETMIADLRKSKAVQVVEREQIAHALEEIKLQTEAGAEVASAARIGKIVGAQTLVLGGFQRAGKQLRITARFVTVETGVVQDTAKVTGDIERIFVLQDQIVARLIGRTLASATSVDGKKRSTGKPTVDAYKLYSQSLAVSSPDRRAQLLRDAIKIDPSFSYALDDLEALEKRLNRYRAESERAVDETLRSARAAVDAAGIAADERSRRVYALFTAELTAFRYRALIEDATRLRQLDLPPYGTMSIRESADYYLFLGHLMLKQLDLALQYGERYLASYPTGMFRAAVEPQMRFTMQELRTREELRAEVDKDLATIEDERAKLLASATSGRPVQPLQVLSLDLRRCATTYQKHQYQSALTECAKMIDHHAQETEPDRKKLVSVARWYQILALAELGRFDEARLAGLQMQAADPEQARDYNVDTVMGMWPRD